MTRIAATNPMQILAQARGHFEAGQISWGVVSFHQLHAQATLQLPHYLKIATMLRKSNCIELALISGKIAKAELLFIEKCIEAIALIAAEVQLGRRTLAPKPKQEIEENMPHIYFHAGIFCLARGDTKNANTYFLFAGKLGKGNFWPEAISGGISSEELAGLVADDPALAAESLGPAFAFIKSTFAKAAIPPPAAPSHGRPPASRAAAAQLAPASKPNPKKLINKAQGALSQNNPTEAFSFIRQARTCAKNEQQRAILDYLEAVAEVKLRHFGRASLLLAKITPGHPRYGRSIKYKLIVFDKTKRYSEGLELLGREGHALQNGKRTQVILYYEYRARFLLARGQKDVREGSRWGAENDFESADTALAHARSLQDSPELRRLQSWIDRDKEALERAERGY
ncbi:MAG: hypothetical protein HQ596_06315 [Candidatus Saganbacteria bacterium]|nr:hypothetical protein [Candidatus Saganbacteria bacterium]